MNRWHRVSATIDGLSVRAQLAGGFGALILMLLGLGGLALVSLSAVNSAAGKIALQNMPDLMLSTSMRSWVLEFRELEIKHTKAPDASYQAEYEEKLEELAARVNTALAEYAQRPRSDAEGESFAALQKAWGEYGKINERVLALGRSGKEVDAQDVSEGAAAVAAMESIVALDKLTAYNFESGKAAQVRAQERYAATQTLIAAIIGAAVLTGLALTLMITRNLLRQLGGEPRAAARIAAAVADGDLSTRIQLRAGDRSSVMAQLADMQARLSTVVARVRQGSQQVANASDEIARGSSALAERTDQQASSLQQTAASMQQLGSAVVRNADSARQANALAELASTVAVKGGRAVGDVVGTMQGINDSSRRIADIIGTIDSIAFQTNILALNAAVEAARAGEQGRGFAVVASEVRSLAQRSAEAAKEIKTLIRSSVERVEQGTAEVDKAGSTMKEIVDSIQRVTQIVGEITSASAEQQTGVEQVGAAMSAMDQSTQRNAAMVGESSSAARRLHDEAQALVEVVAQFKLQPVA
jgi:methyl-accepting chemotaxis protein